MRVHRRPLATVVTAAAVVAVTFAAPVGSAAPAAKPAAAPADTPTSTVEDTSYPGAAQILAERGIKLIGGDGTIQLATCGPSGLIELRSTEKGRVCFKAEPAYWGGRYRITGYIALEIPSVYLIKGDEKDVEATLTVNNQTKVYPIDKNAWTPVGEGAGPGNPPETLLEIRASAP
ncbi:hypothetical protein KIPE111705_28985 [Kibdelosporangium persicum]|uniref:Secreted protein n=1 Tax=Kibdelosporangium persicum TaxID=2698649 RepID=A0ABX2F6B6_9PSEU|nr:hypothetical protein [Kibdelosporangium persicum]NRN66358.1 hypothetical protein [Kibdelosporangium persicum]